MEISVNLQVVEYFPFLAYLSQESQVVWGKSTTVLENISLSIGIIKISLNMDLFYLEGNSLKIGAC